MPCHAMPCHAMPCHAIPCHTIPSARVWFLHYTDRNTSPLIISEIFVLSLYRQNFLAAERSIIGEILAPSLYRQNYHGAGLRRDFRAFIIQTELPRHWLSARFSCLPYTDRITSSLIIGEILVPSLYRQKFYARGQFEITKSSVRLHSGSSALWQ